MTEPTAVYYGQVELIPGIFCDGYVLDDGTAVMSEYGTADLLGMHHKTLRSIVGSWPPKQINSFINKTFIIVKSSVQVTANNCPYKGRNINVYTAEMIETLISAYARALAYHTLQENQKHIGDRCVILATSLIRSALDTAIKQACGLPTNIQQTAQQNYIDVVKIVKERGFKCSIPNDIAIKKDIAQFLDIPET